MEALRTLVLWVLRWYLEELLHEAGWFPLRNFQSILWHVGTRIRRNVKKSPIFPPQGDFHCKIQSAMAYTLMESYLYACPKLCYARNRSRTACFNERFLKQAILSSKKLARNAVDTLLWKYSKYTIGFASVVHCWVFLHERIDESEFDKTTLFRFCSFFWCAIFDFLNFQTVYVIMFLNSWWPKHIF